MIEEGHIQDAVIDFKRYFGNDEEPVVSKALVNGEEMIVVENSEKRAFYSVAIQLIKLINLGGS